MPGGRGRGRGNKTPAWVQDEVLACTTQYLEGPVVSMEKVAGAAGEGGLHLLMIELYLGL